MGQAETQEILDLSQQETVDISKLPTGVPIRIGKNVICLEGPIKCVESFDELLTTLRNRYDMNTILSSLTVIAPNVSNEFTQKITDYIKNKLYMSVGAIDKLVTKHTIDRLTDAEIYELSGGNEEHELTWYYTQKYASCVTKFNKLKAEFDVLDAKLRNGVLTDTEKARGDLLYSELLPKSQADCAEARDNLIKYREYALNKAIQMRAEAEKTVSNSFDGSAAVSVADVTADVSVQSSVAVQSDSVLNGTADESVAATEPVPIIADEAPPVGPDWVSDIVVCPRPKWLDQNLCVMPFSVAAKLIRSSDYARYLTNQTQSRVPGMISVLPEYLLMLGIEVYSTDLPVVFTSSGEFMRVGESDHPFTDVDYWYPKPKFYKQEC